MGWLNAPSSGVTGYPAVKGLQDWTVYNGLIVAFRERAQVAQSISSWGGSTDYTTYNPFGNQTGAYFADASAIATFQADILSLADSGVWTRDSLLTGGSMSGLDPRDDLLSQTDPASIVWGTGSSDTNNIADAVGVGRSGADIFTRKYGLASSPTTGYGTCQPGNFVGVYTVGGDVSPLWWEAFAILNELNFAVAENNFTETLLERRQSANEFDVDRNVAIADATTGWNADAWSDFHIQSNVAVANTSIDFGAGNYFCQMTRHRFKLTLTSCPTGIDSVAELYLFTSNRLSQLWRVEEFDDEGLGYVQDLLSLTYTSPTGASGSRLTSYIGDNTIPPPVPSGDGSSGRIDRGWSAERTASGSPANYQLFKPIYEYSTG